MRSLSHGDMSFIVFHSIFGYDWSVIPLSDRTESSIFSRVISVVDISFIPDLTVKVPRGQLVGNSALGTLVP